MIGPFEHEGKRRPAVKFSAEPEETENEEEAPVKTPSKRKSRKTKSDNEVSEELPTALSSSSKRRRAGSTSSVEEQEEEQTLGKRLEELSKQMTALEQSAEDELKRQERSKQGPTADSLVTLLDQALQSGDAALLEQCLQCTDLNVIDVTTRNLSTHRVLKLLKSLVNKFEKRPSRGLLVTRWISCILKNHLSFLITVPDLSSQLAGLSQMLEQRLQSYTRLSSLAGRLDLLMAQISSRKESQLIEEATYFQPMAVQEED